MTDIIRLEPYSQIQQGGVPSLLLELSDVSACGTDLRFL